MSLKLKTILFLTVILLSVIGCMAYGYIQLKNPFDEMLYGETHYYTNLYHVADLSDSLGSTSSHRSENDITPITINEETLAEDEEIIVYITNLDAMLIQFSKQLTDSTYFYMTYRYEKQQLVPYLEIANTNVSKVYIEENIKVATSKNYNLALKDAYWFSSSKGLPSLQLTNVTDVLTYLKPYGIDEEWLNEKSNDVLYHIILKRWFENGSQRYSLDNLGDVKIVPLAFTD